MPLLTFLLFPFLSHTLKNWYFSAKEYCPAMIEYLFLNNNTNRFHFNKALIHLDGDITFNLMVAQLIIPFYNSSIELVFNKLAQNIDVC